MKKLLYILTLALALLAAPPSTRAQTDEFDVVIEDDEAPDAAVTPVTLAWSPNPEQDIAGYNLYYGRGSGSYNHLKTVTVTTTTIGIRGTRTTYFAVTAFNANGVESDFSEEVQWP